MSGSEIPQRETIGLIAGSGKFPIIFAKEAKKRKKLIFAIAIKTDTNPALRKFVDKIYWLELSDFEKMFKIFQQENIKKAIMAGQINPMRLFSEDLYKCRGLADFLNSIEDKRADTIFGAINQKLKSIGVELIDSTTYLSDYLSKKGVLTKEKPTSSEWNDIHFGFDVAKIIGRADVGQTVAVKNKIIVAVEAIEGTDATIKRAGIIAGPGIIIVKTSKPNQDMRFDIPLVGLGTIKNLIRIKAACLAIEAKKTLILDREDCVKLADKNSISIIAV